MSELEEAIKLFGREDLLGGYGIQDTDTNIEVFMSIKDMVKYYRQDLEIERLNNDIKELLKENSNKEKVIIAQDNTIKEVRELLNQDWYSVLRKGTITKAREILDKENSKTKEVMPVEELEEYEPKNMAEQEYQDWFWD